MRVAGMRVQACALQKPSGMSTPARRGPHPFIISATLLLAATLHCSQARAEFTATATTPDLMTLYMARCGPGWVAGDGAFSARLPNNDIAWLFGDSVVGRVDSAGKLALPPGSSAIFGTTLAIQNVSSTTAPEFVSYFRQGSNVVQTVAKSSYKAFPYDTANCPSVTYQIGDPVRSLFTVGTSHCSDPTKCLWWPMGAIVEGTKLRTFIVLMDLVSQTPKSTYLTSLSTSNFKSAPTTPVKTPNNNVRYGAELMNEGGYTYIYGTRVETVGSPSCNHGECMHIARVPTGSLSSMSEWRFYAGQNAQGQPIWSQTASATKPIVYAGSSYSVTKMSNCGTLPTCYVLLQSFAFGAIIASYAATPYGPPGSWSPFKAVHFAFGTSGDAVPETLQPYVVSYGAQVHELAPPTSDGYLVGYSLNTVGVDCWNDPHNPACPYENVGNYRPRFVRVKFTW
jgi:hypothetical protein